MLRQESPSIHSVPEDRRERKRTGDSGLSIEERYKDQTDYAHKVSRAGRALVEERYLLPEVAERIIEATKKSEIFLAKNDG
jgi:Alpha/beta hydrolase domain